MKIIIDANGGDNAPNAVIEGVDLALNENSNLEITITGTKDVLSLIEGMTNKSRVVFEEATDVITNDDAPVDAVRKKPNSSLVKGLSLLKSSDEYSAFVSAGSTGALLAGAYMKVGRINGINRPALVSVLPTVDGGKVLFLDCGVNADCKSQNLVQFALMGKYYFTGVLGIDNPKVGLLNNGAESHKGNELTKETYELLSAEKSINFVGNIEARDILSGNADIVVSDGFSGNVAIKSMEGMASSIFYLLKKNIKSSGLKGKLGALLLKNTFKSLKSEMDYNRYGGAILLGIEKPIVKVHGASKAYSFAMAINQALKIVESDVVGKIKNAVNEGTETCL